MKRFIVVLLALALCAPARAESEKLSLSDFFTTHICFATEVTYFDLSNPNAVMAKVVETNKNVVAIRACGEFRDPCSVTVMESSGVITTFIVTYNPEPDELVIDMPKILAARAGVEPPVRKERRAKQDPVSAGGVTIAGAGGTIAPTLESVMNEPRQIYHVGDKQYDISVYCYNIFVYNDITYLVLHISNKSAISYRTDDPEFVVENRRKAKRQIEYADKVAHRSKSGSLNVDPDGESRIVYCFDKITLSRDQIFNVYIYEKGGQRNLVLRFEAKDFNNARRIK